MMTQSTRHESVAGQGSGKRQNRAIDAGSVRGAEEGGQEDLQPPDYDTISGSRNLVQDDSPAPVSGTTSGVGGSGGRTESGRVEKSATSSFGSRSEKRR
jgi:hypothetical protein